MISEYSQKVFDLTIRLIYKVP